MAVGLEPLAVRALGSRAPAWSHWLCSAGSPASAPHAAALGGVGGAGGVGGTGGAGVVGGVGGALHTALAVLAVHWPHFLPILLALGTVAYLWRADARHRAQLQATARPMSGSAMPGPG